MRAIAGLPRQGREVIADTPPGQFDGHGQTARRGRPILARIVTPDDLPQAADPAPAFRVAAPNNDVETYCSESRGHPLLALQRHAAGRSAGNRQHRSAWTPCARHRHRPRLRPAGAADLTLGSDHAERSGDRPLIPVQGCLWIGSTQNTASGFSTGSISRLTTTASLSLRTSTHSRVSSLLALIS